MSDVRVSLEDVSIAAPCRVEWRDMVGTDKVRTCSMCKLHVYNLSEMTKKEAEDMFSANSSGNFCLKLFRRFDGTILTKDCSISRRIIDKSTQRLRWLALSLLSFFNIAPAFAQGQLSNISSVDRYGFGVNYSINNDLGNKETREMQERLRNYEGEGADTRALTYFNRARSYEGFGKFKEAVSAYDQAISIIRSKDFNGDPKFAQLVAAREIILLKRHGDSNKAKALEHEFCLNKSKIQSILKLEQKRREPVLQNSSELADEKVVPNVNSKKVTP